MADEYISREAALVAIRSLYPGIPFTKRLMQKWHEENRNFMQCESAIEELPAADVDPMRHGRWIWDDEGYHCSECFYHAYGETGEVLSGNWHYCPNCGAKMDGEQ